MGSVKGRIEAVRVRIEQGATVDADVIVDEAIVAGEFTGNLTCRERLEARPSGRINGRVETFKLMLHEGASVEGEMHMLTERPRDASETIRGSAPLRGDVVASAQGQPARSAAPRRPQPCPSRVAPARRPSRADRARSPGPAATRPAPSWRQLAARSRTPAQPGGPAPAQTPAPPSARAAPRAAPSQLPSVEAILAQRSTVAETLRLETLRVAPRATTSTARPSGTASSPDWRYQQRARSRNGTTHRVLDLARASASSPPRCPADWPHGGLDSSHDT